MKFTGFKFQFKQLTKLTGCGQEDSVLLKISIASKLSFCPSFYNLKFIIMKTILIFFAFLFSFINSYSQVSTSGSGWRWYNPSPMGNDVSSFSIAPDGTQYLCGAKGTLLKSTNDGLTFESMSPIGETELREIRVLENSLKIIVVGQDGARVSTNGGAVWGSALLGERLNTCDVLNGVIYVAGDLGKIYKSTDGGVLFNIVYNNPITDFNAINILPNGNVIATGSNGIVMYSTNNGANFVALHIGGLTNFKGVSFINNTTGVAVGTNSSIFKTTNGGINWTPYNLPGMVNFNDVKMISQNVITAVSNDGDIYFTNDGGINWQLNFNIGPFDLYTIAAANDKVIAYGEGGVSAVSTNGGVNWTTNNSIVRNTINKIEGFDVSRGGSGNDTIRAVGNNGLIMISTNSGNSWQTQNSGVNFHLYSLHFINNLTGWVVGGNTSGVSQRLIMKTTNGGVNWFLQYQSGLSALFDIAFTDSLNGTSVGNFGGMMRTTNGGTNWVNVSGISMTLNDLVYINATTGYITGESGSIYKTTNAGMNWYQVNSGGFFDTQFAIEFSDVNTGYSVGSQGKIYKTTNGGDNWTALQNITTNTLRSIKFANAFTGYISGTNLGNDCSILKTTNGGLNWFRQNTGTNNELKSLYCIDGNNVLTGGTYGTILKTTNGGVSVGIIKINQNLPNEFTLHQNYPNPFNPTTNIRFEISKSSDVKLKIFNILGEEISTLVNQFMLSGVYEVTWNAERYPSGVYFYRIENSYTSKTMKMILVK